MFKIFVRETKSKYFNSSLPENPADEKRAGKKLTAYLFRGSEESEPEFVK